jgi:fucose 4-O-acetylase-like acetyltransferase
MNDRITWVDALRGFSMISILWFHTEMYYAGKDIIPYALYVEDVLAVFFFLSGYVMYKKETGDYKRMLWSVFRWLFIPYVVFTSLIALPKALVHQSFDGFTSIIVAIVTGHASWFVSSLIVSKLLYIGLLFFFKPSVRLLSVSAAVTLFLSALIGNAESPWHYEYDLWCINEALLGFSLMSAGMLFRRYEDSIVKWLYSLSGFLVLLFLVIITKYFILTLNAKMVFGPIIVSNYPLFLLNLTVCLLLLVVVFMRLPKCNFLVWVGRHSIVYYFFSGGCPLLISIGLNHIGFGYKCYAQIPLVWGLVFVFSSLLVALVYRYSNIVRRT